MKRLVAVGLLLILTPPACRPGPRPPAPPDRGRITQVSVINALLLGRYDGVTPARGLLRHGDFGLGTFDHLDGELIVLDGRVYQARGDGVVREVLDDLTTPFAVVTPFDAEGQFACPEVASLDQLDARLDDALHPGNAFYAVRVDGTFASLTLRSVPCQEPPYARLAEVSKRQSVWTHRGLSGTLVGIRCPPWAAGLNVPGYHWHFLSTDRKVGGHVIDCRAPSARVAYDRCRSWLIELGEPAELEGADLGRDLGGDLERVERLRQADPPGAKGSR